MSGFTSDPNLTRSSELYAQWRYREHRFKIVTLHTFRHQNEYHVVRSAPKNKFQYVF
jgi:hypothetical protein